MYIAIEGIKGSGKSTIVKGLLNDYRIKSINPVIFPITAPMDQSHPLEVKLSNNSENQQPDYFIEKLFICRAYWHQYKINDRSALIIGDRSIATACVTRWNKWGDSDYTCKRIKYQYAGIMKPQVIIWLDTSIEFAVNNISKRYQKITGKNDERLEKIKESQIAYSQLLVKGVYEKHFGFMKVESVKNDGNLENVIFNIKTIIEKYNN